MARSLVTNEGAFARLRVVVYFSAKEIYEWWSELPATRGKPARRGQKSSRLKTEAWGRTWEEYKKVRQERNEKFEDFRKRVMESVFQSIMEQATVQLRIAHCHGVGRGGKDDGGDSAGGGS